MEYIKIHGLRDNPKICIQKKYKPFQFVSDVHYINTSYKNFVEYYFKSYIKAQDKMIVKELYKHVGTLETSGLIPVGFVIIALCSALFMLFLIFNIIFLWKGPVTFCNDISVRRTLRFTYRMTFKCKAVM